MAKKAIETFEQVNVVIDRILRRMNKHVVGAFSPSIVAFYTPEIKEDKKVGSFLVPIDATVTNISLHVTKVDKKNPATVSLVVDSGGMTTTVKVDLTRESITSPQSIAIHAGDIVSIFADAPEGAEVMASFVVMATMGNYRFEQYLLDNVEAESERVRDSINKSISSGPTN
jgi:hydrogenase maturation factor